MKLVMPHRRMVSNEDWVWLYFKHKHDASRMCRHIRAIERVVQSGPLKGVAKKGTYCCGAAQLVSDTDEWAICANIHAPNFPHE